MLYRDIKSFDSIALEETLTESLTKDGKEKEPTWDDGDTRASSAPTESEARKASEDIDEKKGLITGLIEIVSDLFGKLFSNFNGQIDALLSKDDSSFITKYNEAKRKYKPNVPIQKVTWRCDTAPADAALSRMRSFVNKATAEADVKTYGAKLDKDSIMEVGKDELTKRFLEAMQAPNNCKSINDYFNYLETVCKGSKANITINEDQLMGYENVALLRADALTAKMKQDQINKEKIINQIRTNYRLVSNSKNLNNEIRGRAKKYSDRLKEISELYVRFLRLYIKIKVNKINTARSILTTVYDIK